MDEKPQVFVKLEEYEDVLDIMNTMRLKLNEANELLNNITKLKESEDKEIQVWQSQLEEIDKKIALVSNNLFEAN